MNARKAFSNIQYIFKIKALDKLELLWNFLNLLKNIFNKLTTRVWLSGSSGRVPA
jgi:hypothetical protein